MLFGGCQSIKLHNDLKSMEFQQPRHPVAFQVLKYNENSIESLVLLDQILYVSQILYNNIFRTKFMSCMCYMSQCMNHDVEVTYEVD